MKNKNGFIATSLLYSFFLAFITLFIGMITIYLQNRVYLIKLEDSSKNSIYINELKDKISSGTTINAQITYINSTKKTTQLTSVNGNVFKDSSSNEYNLARCESIYFEGTNYYIEGCPTS